MFFEAEPVFDGGGMASFDQCVKMCGKTQRKFTHCLVGEGWRRMGEAAVAGAEHRRRARRRSLGQPRDGGCAQTKKK